MLNISIIYQDGLPMQGDGASSAGESDDIENQLELFLARHCPKPAIIIAAIRRTSLWTVHDKRSGEAICRRGETATACWLILDGQVEVQSDNRVVTFRKSGELIGEQAFLHTLAGKNGVRTADVVARGHVRLACIDAAFQERLTDEERLCWIMTIASVVNSKLEEATGGRSKLRQSIDEGEALLRRFADGDALGIVKLAAENRTSPVQEREAIVYFSDIANFSSWATCKPPVEVGRLARLLASAQIESIRGAGGTVDKVMGDGIMAYWFIDTRERARNVPPAVIECARTSIENLRAIIAREGLDGLDVRIGLHTGPVAFGDFGATDRIAVTIFGETVNLAARYEQAKSPGLRALRISPELKTLADNAGAALPGLVGPTVVEVKHGLSIDIFSI